jgi:uncharacterized C2H2 Zn-finger protein
MVFTCSKCGQIFLHETAYKTHFQRHLETRIGSRSKEKGALKQ